MPWGGASGKARDSRGRPRARQAGAPRPLGLSKRGQAVLRDPGLVASRIGRDDVAKLLDPLSDLIELEEREPLFEVGGRRLVAFRVLGQHGVEIVDGGLERSLAEVTLS